MTNAPQNTATQTVPHNAIVWFEIPVRDLDASITFYNAILSCEMKPSFEMGPQAIAVLPFDGTGVSGNLYTDATISDQPARGPRVHLLITGTLESAIARCTAAGGAIHSPAITIPEGRFAHATDLDGNPLALFEAKAA